MDEQEITMETEDFHWPEVSDWKVEKKNKLKERNRKQKRIEKLHSMSGNNHKMLKISITGIVLALQILYVPIDGAMNLPDGIENVLGFVPRSTFQCERDGYFGDIDNDCRIFHLCQKQVHPGGRIEWRHWTYACGNQTMFNQLTLTCAFVDEAIPCKHASQFQYLNEVIHKPKEPFLTDADVTSGVSYYSNRIMSDGARARAFEDSQLLAQLGGGSSSAAASQVAPLTSSSIFSQPSASANNEAEEEDDRSSGSTNSIESSVNSLPTNGFSFQSQTQNQNQQVTPINRQQVVVAQNVNDQPSLPHFHFFNTQSSSANTAAQAPESFGFSISTNHQQVQSVPLSQPATQLSAVVQQTTLRPQLPALIVTPSAATPPPPPPPQQTTSSTRQLSAAATTTTTAATTGFPQVLPASQATTTIGNRQDPPTSTQRSISTTSNSSSAQLRRRQPSSTTERVRTTRPPFTGAFRSSEFATQFQSTRIASTSSQQSSRRNPEPALVMRRHQPQPLPQQQPAAPPTQKNAISTPSNQENTSGITTFWSRPFDAHFLAPRFESLLMRRRV